MGGGVRAASDTGFSSCRRMLNDKIVQPMLTTMAKIEYRTVYYVGYFFFFGGGGYELKKPT